MTKTQERIPVCPECNSPMVGVWKAERVFVAINHERYGWEPGVEVEHLASRDDTPDRLLCLKPKCRGYAEPEDTDLTFRVPTEADVAAIKGYTG